MRSPIPAFPEFEVVGVCERRIAKREAARGAEGREEIRRFRHGARRTEAGRRLDQHAARHPCRVRHQGDGGGRPCLRREAARRQRRERREGGRHRQADRQEAGGRLHPPPASVLDEVHRDRAAARHAARLPHEPQPAVQRRDLGLAQAADGLLPADRRLRRPLCRRHVPDDQGEADQGACHRRAAHRRGASSTITACCR